MTTRTLTARGFLPVLCAPLLVYAQISQSGNTGFSECASIVEDSARLACYDAYASGVSSPPAIHDASNERLIQGNRRIREEIARMRMEQAGGQITPSVTGGSGGYQSNVIDNDDGGTEIVGRIADLKSVPSGWIVTLELGQVWRQMISKRYDLHKGQVVRIYPTGWGDAYRLTAENNSGYIQVERIQ